MEELLQRAIAERQILHLIYGTKSFTVEPHMLSRTTTGGCILSAYQAGGFGVASNDRGWKLFDLQHITHAEMVARHFSGSRPGYDPNGTMFTCIIAHV